MGPDLAREAVAADGSIVGPMGAQAPRSIVGRLRIPDLPLSSLKMSGLRGYFRERLQDRWPEQTALTLSSFVMYQMP